MTDRWRTLKEWPELILERLEDAGVARVVLNRPDKRNCLNAPLVTAFFELLDMIRADRELKVVITKGAGPTFSSGLDLNFLRSVSSGGPRDWDRPTLTIQLAEAIRVFPRVMIAQVHGYCLGGALGHHEHARSGVRSRRRATRDAGSVARQLWTARHQHAAPRPHSNQEGGAHSTAGPQHLRQLGSTTLAVASKAYPAQELEAATMEIAREIALRHLAPLEHAKIAVQMGRDLTLSQAVQLDQLVGSRQQLTIDPTGDLKGYLELAEGRRQYALPAAGRLDRASGARSDLWTSKFPSGRWRR